MIHFFKIQNIHSNKIFFLLKEAVSPWAQTSGFILLWGPNQTGNSARTLAGILRVDKRKLLRGHCERKPLQMCGQDFCNYDQTTAWQTYQLANKTLVKIRSRIHLSHMYLLHLGHSRLYAVGQKISGRMELVLSGSHPAPSAYQALLYSLDVSLRQEL